MSHLLKKSALIAGLTVGSLLAAPAANAVETTNGGATTVWGTFYCSYLSTSQHTTTWPDTADRLTWRCSWKDRLVDGHGVYLQVQGVRTGPMPDTGWNRLTSNASGAGTTVRSKGWWEARTINYFEVRICRQQTGSDPCSGKVHVDS